MPIVTTFHRNCLAVLALLAAATSALSQPFGAPPPPVVQPANPLVWDSMAKEYRAKPGDTTNVFRFWVTNTSPQTVWINGLRPSCGCTVAKLPSQPWELAPGTNGPIEATINFAGKPGVTMKAITVESSVGVQVLSIKVIAPELAPRMGNRQDNQELARVNRQAVFQNDCASCHVTPTLGKVGEPLYLAACAICHDAEHRATVVPDLKAVANRGGAEYWRKWIREGRETSLMPAFAMDLGGPLSPEQINSLVDFLAKKFPATSPVSGEKTPTAKPATPPVPAPAAPTP